MTTQPESGSGAPSTTTPVEQIAGRDVGAWVEFEDRWGIPVAGYLVGLEVNCALIDDTALCEADLRYVQQTHYSLYVQGRGTYRLVPGQTVTVRPPAMPYAAAAARMDTIKRSLAQRRELDLHPNGGCDHER